MGYVANALQMNTSTSILISMSAGMVFLGSFNYNNSAPVEISFLDAVNKGLIHYSSKGAGGFNGKSVILKLQNSSNTNYTVRVEPGTLFYPDDAGQQTLITTENQFVTLNAGTTKSETINAYCSEHSDRSPNTSTVFTAGRNRNPKFDSLFQFIATRKIPEIVFQAVVWSISDNSPISHIANNTKNLRSLRKFLSQLTGQEEVDYSIDMITSTDQEGYIIQKAYQVKGYVTFNSEKTKWIHQEVFDEQNKLKFKSEQAFEIPRGESDYSFNIIVKNWKPGKYTLKLKAGSDVVETYSFHI